MQWQALQETLKSPDGSSLCLQSSWERQLNPASATQLTQKIFSSEDKSNVEKGSDRKEKKGKQRMGK